MPPKIVYQGWIGANEGDQHRLWEMGFSVGSYNQEGHAFDSCEGSPDAFRRLQKEWKWLFILKPVKIEEIDEDIPF